MYNDKEQYKKKEVEPSVTLFLVLPPGDTEIYLGLYM